MSDRIPEAELQDDDRDQIVVAIDIERDVARGALLDIAEREGRLIATSRYHLSHPLNRSEMHEVVVNVLKALQEMTGLSLIDAEDIQPHVDVVLTGTPAERLPAELLIVGDSELADEVIQLMEHMPVDEIVRRFEEGYNEATTSNREIGEVDVSRRGGVAIVLGTATDPDALRGIGQTLSHLAAEEAVQSALLLLNDQQQQTIAHRVDDLKMFGIDPATQDAPALLAAVGATLRDAYWAQLGDDSTGEMQQFEYVTRGRAIDLVVRFLARLRRQMVAAVILQNGALLGLATEEDACVRDLASNGAFERHLGILTGHLAMDTEMRSRLSSLIDEASSDDRRSQPITRCLRAYADLVAGIQGVIPRETKQTGVPSPKLIIGSGDVENWLSSDLLALALNDGFLSTPDDGLVELVWDSDGVASSLGAIGERWPVLAADAIVEDLLQPLGTVIVVNGEGDDGQLAVTGEISIEGGSTTSFAVPFGSIERLPVAAWDSASLTIRREVGVTVGTRTEQTVTFDSGELRGGTAGILIDARRLRTVAERRQSTTMARIESWFADLGIVDSDDFELAEKREPAVEDSTAGESSV